MINYCNKNNKLAFVYKKNVYREYDDENFWGKKPSKDLPFSSGKFDI